MAHTKNVYIAYITRLIKICNFHLKGAGIAQSV
jgi:hypothetical protein